MTFTTMAEKKQIRETKKKSDVEEEVERSKATYLMEEDNCSRKTKKKHKEEENEVLEDKGSMKA